MAAAIIEPRVLFSVGNQNVNACVLISLEVIRYISSLPEGVETNSETIREISAQAQGAYAFSAWRDSGGISVENALKLMQEEKTGLISIGHEERVVKKIVELSEKDKKVRGIDFSRNFGHQIALSAGYDAAKGGVIVSMDTDMQDPPELIVDMVKKWEEGAPIVYARRIERKDGFLKKLTASWYYKLLDSVSDVRIPRNVGDFRLIDKSVLEQLKNCPEKSRYLRGMVAWLGFKPAYIDFRRPNRVAGETGYSWKRMLKFAFDGITSFSMFPLKIAFYVGFFMLALGGFSSIYLIVEAIRGNFSFLSWMIWFGFICVGLEFIVLWFLGEYIGRLYDQAKGRPLYIVSEKINLD